MNDHDRDVGAPALDTNIESGGFDEKRAHDAPAPAVHEGGAAPPPKKVAEEEDEDEDIDALIEDLESEDGHQHEDEEDEQVGSGTTRAKVVPEELLQTSTVSGLTEAEVTNRRRKYGYNQMKEDKPNHILKFLGFFVGPIQFVMEVSKHCFFSLITPMHSQLFIFTCGTDLRVS